MTLDCPMRRLKIDQPDSYCSVWLRLSCWSMAAQYVMEDLARIPVRVELASEFRYRNPIAGPQRSGHYCISQSGETADSLAALREAKKRRYRNTWYRQCGRFLYRQRSRPCLLHTGRSGDRSCNNEGLQHTADCRLCSGNAVRPMCGAPWTRASTSELIAELQTFPAKIKKIIGR